MGGKIELTAPALEGDCSHEFRKARFPDRRNRVPVELHKAREPFMLLQLPELVYRLT